MMKDILALFAIEKKPVKGLLLLEWAMLGYALLTLLMTLFMQTQLQHPQQMLWLRFHTTMITLALWAVYRMVPCRLTLFFRVGMQLLMLGPWYSETFEFNRVLPNLDHVFASAEQWLFGFQPALEFSRHMGWPWLSELMMMGYLSYFMLIGIVIVYYLIWRSERFLRASFVVLAAFFLFYVIYLFLPVSGPQFYYPVVGTDEIALGHFPQIGTYFMNHDATMHPHGYSDGFFYKMLLMVHETGERPTAAFPSSHVGITTILLLLAWQSGSRRLFWGLLPFALLLFLSTVYIQAHYAIDAIAGFFVGVLMFLLLQWVYSHAKHGEERKM